MFGQMGFAMFVIFNRSIIERKALEMQNIVRHICCHDCECQVLTKICMYKQVFSIEFILPYLLDI